MFAAQYFPSIPIHPIKKVFGKLSGFIFSKWFMDNQSRPAPAQVKAGEAQKEVLLEVVEEEPVPVSDETVVATEKYEPAEELPPPPLPADIPSGFFDDVLAAEEAPLPVMLPRTRATRVARAAQQSEEQDAIQQNLPYVETGSEAGLENMSLAPAPEPEFMNREDEMDLAGSGTEEARIGFVSAEETLAAEAQAPAKPRTRTRNARKTASAKKSTEDLSPASAEMSGDSDPAMPPEMPEVSPSADLPPKPARKPRTVRKTSAGNGVKTQEIPRVTEADEENSGKTIKPADAAETAKAAKAAVAKAAKAAVSKVEKVAAGTAKPAKEEIETKGIKKTKSAAQATQKDAPAEASKTAESDSAKSSPRKRTRTGAAKSAPAKAEPVDGSSKNAKKSGASEKNDKNDTSEEPAETLNADEMIVVDESTAPSDE
jgi:hypothetical protein